MIEDYLPFVGGWNYDTSTNTVQIPRGSTKSFQTSRLGWIIRVLINATDRYATITLIIDDNQVNVSPDFLITNGFTSPNNNFPYLVAGQPTVGSAGNFVIAYVPARPLPIQSNFTYDIALGNQSTQNSCSVYTEVTTYFITDKTTFLKDLQAYYSAIAPSFTFTLQTSSGQESGTATPIVPGQGQTSKSNVFLEIPRIKIKQKVLNEEEEIGQYGR